MSVNQQMTLIWTVANYMIFNGDSIYLEVKGGGRLFFEGTYYVHRLKGGGGILGFQHFCSSYQSLRHTNLALFSVAT